MSTDLQFEEREIHLSDYFDVLYKRKGMVILFFLVTVAVTTFATFRAVPIYQSTATLIIDKEDSVSPITGERTSYETTIAESLTFQTHSKLITSTPVLLNVSDALKLDEIDEEELEISSLKKIIRQFKDNVKTLLAQFNSAEGALFTLDDPESGRINELLESLNEKITIEAVRDTRLLSISVQDKSPTSSADIANTLVKKYIEFNLSNRVESSKDNLAWLNNELYNLKKKLEDDERKFFEYKQQSKVFSMEGKQKVMDQKIAEFNNQYLATRNKGLELDSKIEEIERNLRSGGAAHVRSLISNPIIDELYNKVMQLEIEHSGLSKVFGSKHPKIVLVRSDLDKSRAKLSSELNKEVGNLKSERKVLRSREEVLQKTIEESEQDALQTSGQELQYSILQRNVNTSQNLYDALLSRVKESDILKTSDTSNIRLVESARIPTDPVSPKKKRNILLSIILGLFGGAGLAFFFEYLDQSLRTEDDIVAYLDIPVLAVVPEADESKGYTKG